MIGLERGVVKLYDHEKEWEIEAQDTIARLKAILGDIIKDIQHVGSTAVTSIKAKPIIDIALAVDDFKDILAFEKELKEDGFYYRPKPLETLGNQLLFACGSYYDGSGNLQTHFIHVVLTGSMDWINYINFRDYLNSTPSVAKEYEKLKLTLAIDCDRKEYLKGKHDFIVYTLRKALVKSYLGKTVTVKIDRPIGYIHKKEKYTLTYKINYGYIPKVIGGDGEELDVYVLGVSEPVDEFTGVIIGIIHRENDVEDKLVAAPVGLKYNQAQIAEAVYFQEQYYRTRIECLYPKSCGAIVYRRINGCNEYLLLLQKRSRTWSFPKGHMEMGETERETAMREIGEEIGTQLGLVPDFRTSVIYQLPGGVSKEVVLFLAEAENEPKPRAGEILEYRWVKADTARGLLYENYDKVLDEVESRLYEMSEL